VSTVIDPGGGVGVYRCRYEQLHCPNPTEDFHPPRECVFCRLDRYSEVLTKIADEGCDVIALGGTCNVCVVCLARIALRG